MKQKSAKELLLESHLRLRRIIGGLGIALPIVLLVWGCGLARWTWSLQDSISDYSALKTQVAFVGILFTIGWFLCAYKGHEVLDDVMGYIGGLFALGVAIFPNTEGSWQRFVHFPCAVGLFLTLSFFSILLFTKTHNSPTGFQGAFKGFHFRAVEYKARLSAEKKKRNIVYIACGIIMLVCLLLVGLYMWLWQNTAISSHQPVFALETIMIWAFGISWLVKGETLLKDKGA